MEIVVIPFGEKKEDSDDGKKHGTEKSGQAATSKGSCKRTA